MISPLLFFLLTAVLNSLAILGAIALARERSDYLKSFVTSLVATFTSTFLLSFIPFNQLFLEILLWIALIKIFFRFSWKITVLVGLVGYAIKFAMDMVGIPGLIMLLIGL